MLPAANEVPQVFVCAKSPVAEMLLILRAELPRFVRVTACPPLVVPTCCDAKVSEFGTRVGSGPSPVPTSAPDCGLPGAVSLIDRLAIREPAAVGANVTFTVQLPPTPNELLQVLVWEKSELFVPIMPILLILKAAFPVFTSMIAEGVLLLPTVCGEKFCRAG